MSERKVINRNTDAIHEGRTGEAVFTGEYDNRKLIIRRYLTGEGFSKVDIEISRPETARELAKELNEFADKKEEFKNERQQDDSADQRD